MLGSTKLPGIVAGDDGVVGLFLLPRIDGVAHVDDARIAGIEGIHGDETRHIRDSVVGEAEEREVMLVQIVDAFAVELVLLAMLESGEKAVAVGEFEGKP